MKNNKFQQVSMHFNRLLFVSIIFIIVSICIRGYALDDHLTVKQNVKADSVIFSGDTTAEPAAPLEGELFYNSTGKVPKYFDGTQWQRFGGSGPKTVASKIVAASNSLDTARADYVCTGTNDQTTIQTAINDLGTLGGAVYLLEGTYNISAPINLDNVAPDDSNKSIIGAGAGTVLKVVSGANNVKVINASNVNRILISQLKIDGNSKTGNNNNGIYFNIVTYSKIDKVWVENMVSHGIFFESSSHNNLSGNHLQSNTGVSYDGGNVYLLNSSNNIILESDVRSSVKYGIDLNGTSSNNIISGNNVQSNSYTGIRLNNNAHNNIVCGNNVRSNGGHGIYAEGSSNHTISGNNVSSNGNDGIALFSSSFSIALDNNILSNVYNGIHLAWGDNNNISGNIIFEVGANYDGIQLESSNDNTLISGNRIYDSNGSRYGINIQASFNPTNNYLIGNLIDGAGFAKPINDSGTNTKYTDKTKMTLEKKTISGISGNYTLDAATFPQTYISFNPTGAITLTLANGKAAGDLLILENTTVNSVSLSEGANVNLGATPRVLGQYDTLELIWNGTVAEGGTGRWLEIKWTDN